MLVEVSLINATDAPPVGAADASVTVPVVLFPETTVAGFRVSDAMLTVTGVTVKFALAVLPE
jgi:hypothetical protein